RNGSRRAKHVFQNPAAARHRRSPCADGADSQETALPQNAAPRARCRQGDTAEVAATNVRNTVVLREPLIYKRVVGIKQSHDAAILVNNAFKKHLRLVPE